LLTTFAEQAVIAITSAETYRALQTRTGELARSETELRGSEERYALVSRAVAEGIYDWDIAQNRLWVSPRLIELFGWEAGEGIGERPSQDWNARVHPEDFERYRAALRAALKGETARLHCEYRIRLNNGEYRWVEDHALPVRDERGWAVRLVGAVSDVTERKEAEQALREALDQQTATTEVLQVINSSPGDLAPVFDAMLEKAMRLCAAAFGYLLRYDGERFQTVAHHGLPPRFAEYLPRMDQPGPTGAYARILGGAPLVHVPDLKDGDVYRSSPLRQALVDLGGARTSLIVALRKDDRLLGIFTIYRQEVRPRSCGSFPARRPMSSRPSKRSPPPRRR
jgi:PAS domain S-box-containing protein